MMIAQAPTVLRILGLVMALLCLSGSSPIGASTSLSAAPPVQPAHVPAGPPAAPLVDVAGPNTPLIGCGASGNDAWTNATDTLSTVRKCSLTVPEAGLVFVSADATVVNSPGGSRGEFDVSIDSTTSGLGARRWVDVRDDGNGGQRMVLARTAMAPITAGSHTIRLLGKSVFPPSTARLDDASLSAVFIPDSSDLMACYADDSEWSTSSPTYDGILKCSIDVPEQGWAFITADASVRWQELDQDLELAFDFDDATSPEGATRFVGAHTGTWAFSPAALSLLKPVKKGVRTFSLVGRRDQGTGQIDVYYPSLNVIYIPSSSANAITCGSSQTDLWFHTSSTWKGIAKCSLNLPTGAWAFVSASSSVNYSDNAYQGEFEVNIGTAGVISRVVNVYDTDDFGKDNTVAVSLLKPIESGTHTFSFEGRRISGTGTMQLFRPTLTAIVPLSTLAEPVLSTPADGAVLCSDKPTFSWAGVDGATSHQIQVDDDPAFASPEIGETVMGADYVVGSSQSLYPGVYHWQVRGLTPYQTGPWSSTWSFTVSFGSDVPDLQAPTDGSTTADTTPTFTWSAVPRGEEYRIMISRDAGFGSVVVDAYTFDTDYTPPSPLDGGVHYWRVRSRDDCGSSDWSAPWKLTTGSPLQSIYLPILVR